MKAALDVHYEEDRAVAACVVFDEWPDSEPAALLREVLPAAARYWPGRFFERELPCLLAVLDKARGITFDTILIDGYVHLGTGDGKGLGARLCDALPYAAVVIGVAKSPLAIAGPCLPILRGRSRKPLFVSAIVSGDGRFPVHATAERHPLHCEHGACHAGVGRPEAQDPRDHPRLYLQGRRAEGVPGPWRRS